MELDGYVLKSYTKGKRQDQPATSRLLAYFYPSQTLALQVDSSKDGLGAVLLQNGKPSNLHPARSQLGNTQRPQLFRVHSKKNLRQAPKRLQALVMRLHRYDIAFHYILGRSYVLADH